MANPDNLIPQAHKLTVEEASKGGKKSGEARKRKRSMRDAMEIMLAMSLKPEDAEELTDIEDIRSFAESIGKNITIQDAMVFKQIQLALAGSQKSFEIIRDTVGEKPKERIETNKEALDKLDEVLKNIGGVV